VRVLSRHVEGVHVHLGVAEDEIVLEEALHHCRIDNEPFAFVLFEQEFLVDFNEVDRALLFLLNLSDCGKELLSKAFIALLSRLLLQ